MAQHESKKKKKKMLGAVDFDERKSLVFLKKLVDIWEESTYYNINGPVKQEILIDIRMQLARDRECCLLK